jgi:hypothetical protein
VKKILALASFTVLALASSFAQTNTIQLRNGANTTTIIAPTGGNYTLTLPAGAGTNGQVLSTNGSGTLSWSSTATSIDGLSDAISNSNIVALGSQAGASLTTGGFSVFVGNQAGRDFTGSTNAVAVGYGAMRLATGGDNVSIGTESLNGLTAGTNNVAIGTYAGTTNVTTGSGNVFIGDRVYPSTNVSNKLYIDNAYSASDKPLIYGDFSTDQLTFNGHVEVAIGTTTSTVPFSILGTGIQGAANVENAFLGTDVPTLFVRNTTNSADADAVLLAGVGGSSAGDAYIGFDVKDVGGWSIGLDNSDEDKLKFVDSWNFRSDGGAPALGLPVMTMTRSTRRVGIGTENPAYMLDVAGDINASGALTITGAATVGPYLNVLRLDNESGGEIAIEFGDDDGYWIIEDVSPATGDPERLRIYSGPGGEAAGITLTAAGNVGMGKAAPAYKLDVVGDINASANVRAAGTALTSDARLKRNIQPLTNALDVVQQLRPVSYEKRADLQSNDYSMKQMGFIAQELESVLPNSVQTDKSADAIKSVDYISIIPVLTKALQEQQQTINKQQAEIDELRQLIKRMSVR